jgi:hypothetical protein
MYGSLTTFSNFINITPESIGITESLLLFSSKVLVYLPIKSCLDRYCYAV